MIDLLVGLLADNVIYPLIVPGLMGGAISILFSFFIPTALNQYKLAFLIGGCVAVLFFTFYGGKYTTESKYKMDIAEMNAEIAELKAKSGQITVETVIEYVEKVKYVEKVRTEYVNVYVDSFIPTSVNDSYGNLPNGFIRLHDSAAEGTIPGTPNNTDAAPSEIGIAKAAKVITSNYMVCHQTEEQLLALQEWIRKQSILYNGK